MLKVDNYFENTIKNIFEYSKLKFTFAFLKYKIRIITTI